MVASPAEISPKPAAVAAAWLSAAEPNSGPPMAVHPPGTQPPFIITYNASSVPVLQLALSGKGLSEQQLFDAGVNHIRTQLATVQGAAIPYPYSGKQRQIQVDLDLAALQAKGLAPADVVNAINVQNLILPSGTSKIGTSSTPSR